MQSLDTKLKGDIAEQSVILFALKKEWNVLRPIGDRLPYDIVFEINNIFVKIQVKSAWYDERSENYVVDCRRTKTNRRIMIRGKYRNSDFDFAVIHLEKTDVFYVMPIDVFNAYGSEIAFVECDKRQRKPKSAEYRNAWILIEKWAAPEEILT